MSASITEEVEYQRAVLLLRNFHSRRIVTTSCSSLSSPLDAIDESGSDKSAFYIHDRRGMGQSTSIRKIATSMCLVDLDTPLGLKTFSSMCNNASRR